MIQARLAHELGEPSKQVTKAFDTYNRLVERDPNTLAHIIGRMAAGEKITDDREAPFAHAADAVLDATNDGTRIGIDPANRETAWAQIFDDTDHRDAHTAYGHLGRELARVRRAISDLQDMIDTANDASFQELILRQQQLEQEATALRRQCGMYALRAVALMNIA